MLALGVVILGGCSAPSSPEEVDLPPSAHSLSPAADTVYECLTRKGWDVSISWDGGIEASSDDIPDAQLDLFEKDSDECWRIIDERVETMSLEAIEMVFEQELATRSCLINEGVNVDEPPSKQRYLDTFHDDRWMAYGASDIDSVARDSSEWRRIAQACPQPAWALGAEE
jgi:hypothetical protein